MIAKILIRGMLTGLIAGLFVFAMAKTMGEPYVERAIALEGTLGHSHSHEDAAHAQPGMAATAAEPEEPELFNRETQSGLGLFTGVTAYSTGLGGLFSLVFAFAYGRMGRTSPRKLSALLALCGFIAVVVVPMLKYPANPPAVGDGETIGLRTLLYFSMLFISVTAAVLSVKFVRHFSDKLGSWHAAIFGGLAFIVVIAMAQGLLPTVNEVPEGFPADLLWNFRIVSLGMQAVLWSILGLLFGELTERRMKASAVSGKLALA